MKNKKELLNLFDKDINKLGEKLFLEFVLLSLIVIEFSKLKKVELKDLIKEYKRDSGVLRLKDLILKIEYDVLELKDSMSKLILNQNYKSFLKYFVNILFDMENQMKYFSKKEILNALLFNHNIRSQYKISSKIVKEIFSSIMKTDINKNEINNTRILNLFSNLGELTHDMGISNGLDRFHEIRLQSVEKDSDRYLLGKMINYLLEDFDIETHNESPYKFNKTQKSSFDFVIMNSLDRNVSDYAYQESLSDCNFINNILIYGKTAINMSEWCDYQLALYQLNETGKAIVTTSVSALNRIRDQEIRKNMVEHGIIECVILLPKDDAIDSNIEPALIIFDKKRSAKNSNKILFIDAKKKLKHQTNITTEKLSNKIDKLMELITYKDTDEESVLVNIEDTKRENYSLNPRTYLNKNLIDGKFNEWIPLKEICKIVTGKQLSKKEREELRKNPNAYYLSIKDVENQEVKFSKADKIHFQSENWEKKYGLKPGDVVITARGTKFKAVVASKVYDKTIISNNLFILRVNDKYNNYILVEFLLSDIGQRLIDNITVGKSTNNIPVSKIKELKVPKYENELMEEIGKEIMKERDLYQKRINEAKQNYDNKMENFRNRLDL